MGLIVPQTVKVRTSVTTYKHYKEKGYEFKKCGNFIEVNVFDLPKGSGTKVKIICDICGKKREMCYGDVVKYNEKNELITCGSDSCVKRKREDTCTKRYGKGIINVFQSEEVKEKIKDTNLERHGAENPFGSKEIQDKIKGTWQKNYGEGIINPFQAESVKEKLKQTWQKNYGEGIINPFQAESVKEKSKQTMLNNHGVEYPMQCKEIQDRTKATNLEKYGAENAMQNEEIKNKVLNSFQFNHTGPSSRAQRYINHILNGALNKYICGSLADIYIEKENIIIEHDGSGHFLGDTIKNKNKIPSKEALLREKEREDKIINNGYRMIRFIATKDRIPSDEVILNLIEGFKNFDFKVIRINFEEGIIDRDYEERWYCNFGELRKITKEDLERFEK